MRFLSVVVPSVIVLTPADVASQRVTPVPANAHASLFVRPAILNAEDSTHAQGPLPVTYWREGGMVGGMAGMLAAGYTSGGSSDGFLVFGGFCITAGTVFGGIYGRPLEGGLVGMMVGSLAASLYAGSYQFLLGGGLGLGVGTLIGGQVRKAPRDTTSSR